MLIQIQNRVILLEAVSYASIQFPEENTMNDWIELLLIVDGHSIILHGDEALRIWNVINRNAICLPSYETDISMPPCEDSLFCPSIGCEEDNA